MIKTTEKLILFIPNDVRKEIDAVKRQKFYDKSYAELYRYIIRLGLTKIKEGKDNDE